MNLGISNIFSGLFLKISVIGEAVIYIVGKHAVNTFRSVGNRISRGKDAGQRWADQQDRRTEERKREREERRLKNG